MVLVLPPFASDKKPIRSVLGASESAQFSQESLRCQDRQDEARPFSTEDLREPRKIAAERAIVAALQP
jgi:hypothetical protein